jgi:hypothetical protein
MLLILKLISEPPCSNNINLHYTFVAMKERDFMPTFFCIPNE